MISATWEIHRSSELKVDLALCILKRNWLELVLSNISLFPPHLNVSWVVPSPSHCSLVTIIWGEDSYDEFNVHAFCDTKQCILVIRVITMMISMVMIMILMLIHHLNCSIAVQCDPIEPLLLLSFLLSSASSPPAPNKHCNDKLWESESNIIACFVENLHFHDLYETMPPFTQYHNILLGEIYKKWCRSCSSQKHQMPPWKPGSHRRCGMPSLKPP